VTTQPAAARPSSDLIGLTSSAITPAIHAQIAQPVMTGQQQWGAPNEAPAMTANPAGLGGQSIDPAYPTGFAQAEGMRASSPGITNNNDIGANFDKVFSGGAKPDANPIELFGDILQPMNQSAAQAKPQEPAPAPVGEGADLDTTLSKLATNISLDIRGSMSPKKSDHQWNKQSSQMAGSRTGGATWQPVQMASTTWQQQQQPFMGMGARPIGLQQAVYGQAMVGQPMGAMFMPQQAPPQRMTTQQQPNDPFGNL
jgi:hypothetical protein